MGCSMAGFPVHDQLLELAQTHVHQFGDVIQPPYPLSSPFPLAFNLSRHQDLFQWVSSSHRQPKYWSFSFNISPFNEHSGLISFRMDWLDLLSEDSRVFFNTIVQKHQYIGIQLSLYSTSRIHTWLLETFGKKILQEGEVVGWHHQLEVHEFE